MPKRKKCLVLFGKFSPLSLLVTLDRKKVLPFYLRKESLPEVQNYFSQDFSRKRGVLLTTCETIELIDKEIYNEAEKKNILIACCDSPFNFLDVLDYCIPIDFYVKNDGDIVFKDKLTVPKISVLLKNLPFKFEYDYNLFKKVIQGKFNMTIHSTTAGENVTYTPPITEEQKVAEKIKESVEDILKGAKFPDSYSLGDIGEEVSYNLKSPLFDSLKIKPEEILAVFDKGEKQAYSFIEGLKANPKLKSYLFRLYRGYYYLKNGILKDAKEAAELLDIAMNDLLVILTSSFNEESQ